MGRKKHAPIMQWLMSFFVREEKANSEEDIVEEVASHSEPSEAPKYFLHGDALNHLRELHRRDSDIEELILSDMDKVAANPEKIGAPLDHETLDAIREHLSEADYAILKRSRVFYGQAGTLKWVVIEDPPGTKSASFWYIKPYSSVA